MVSGVGYKGGVSRCFYEWQKFVDCYTAKDTADPRQQCQLLAEDYTECLHHGKEIARAQQIASELIRKQKQGEAVPEVQKTGSLSGTLEDLGLLKQ